MKPAPFEYVRPDTLDEALAVLADAPDESKVLAGGQSLIPMMNFRLARPERLIDINRIPGLSGLSSDRDRVRIETRTRHLALQNTDHPGPLGSLLRRAAVKVGHLPIRTRGTFGGSLAHCDSASEWCLVARLLDAELTVRSAGRGERTVPAEDFFQAIFTTALEPDEILTSISLPELDGSYRTGIAEFARRAGDFAIVAATSAVKLTDGVVTDARVCLGGVHEIPLRARAAEATLLGREWSAELAGEAAAAAAAEVDPPSDAHGDADYRRDLVSTLLTRSLLGHDAEQPTAMAER